MHFSAGLGAIAALVATVSACDGCYGAPKGTHIRNVKRIQPDSQNATAANKPRGPLEWGQLNFLHTTDTHGWLEGHIKEQNYGADWGDYVSFVKHMRKKAKKLDVDLLLIDTGDLHDGNGLSDASAETPDGAFTNPIFENIDYDLLTIGNHELYVSDIAFLTADKFAKYYGEKYISSNVQIYNSTTGTYQDIANKYRYFTTDHGLRIMAFGVLFDFTGNSNASKVTKAADMIKQPWFSQAVNYTEPIDLFLLIGHNPIHGSGSSLTLVQSTIRSMRPDVPIQVFGGHTHIRDFAVYDAGSTGIESGRYCETLGWVSMSGIDSPNFNGTCEPKGVPHPTQKAVKPTPTGNSTVSATPTPSTAASLSNMRYSRRYLDWNRLTFAYHAEKSQDNTFEPTLKDTPNGVKVSQNITELRKELNLTSLYGCAPATYCISCQPFGSPGSIFTLLATALSTTVVNQTRADKPRLILINTGSVRFDLVEGPFTYDDSFIVSPFHDTFQYIPDVPYAQASKVLGILNAGAFQKRSEDAFSRDLTTRDFHFTGLTGDDCVEAASLAHRDMISRRDTSDLLTRNNLVTRNASEVPGYVTKDDFGTNGDDTIHSKIPYYPSPNDLQANASFPTDGSMPAAVDLIFLDFIGANYIIPALKSAGANYTKADLQQYLDPSFDTNAYLPAYAKIAWQANVPNCPVGQGVGF